MLVLVLALVLVLVLVVVVVMVSVLVVAAAAKSTCFGKPAFEHLQEEAEARTDAEDGRRDDEGRRHTFANLRLRLDYG